MEKFYFEEPSIGRKEDAIAYINEFYEYNSDINGTGGLNRYLADYEMWLKKLEEDYARIPDEKKVPARTYFLVREGDNRIIGMINIRLALNESLRKYGGHIGYSIRPTERGKGIDKVLMDADKDNPASWRTMEALGGVNIRGFYDEKNAHCIVRNYEINVDESVRNNLAIYEPMTVNGIFREN